MQGKRTNTEWIAGWKRFVCISYRVRDASNVSLKRYIYHNQENHGEGLIFFRGYTDPHANSCDFLISRLNCNHTYAHFPSSNYFYSKHLRAACQEAGVKFPHSSWMLYANSFSWSLLSSPCS